MHFIQRHSLPLSYVSRNGVGPKEILGASAGLLWVDRPFAVTSARVLAGFLERLGEDDSAHLCLGGLALRDAPSRVLCFSERNGLATLRVDPDELDMLGDDVSFYNPLRWPPKPVVEGEEIRVMGFPHDQWPAASTYTFRVDQVAGLRFGATLVHSDMPGRLQGVCGAPAFRPGSPPELVGIVVDTMFHNEVVRLQHARHVDQCGQVVDDDIC